MGVYRRIPAVCILMDLQRVAMNVRNDGVSTTEILWRPGTMLVSEITTMKRRKQWRGRSQCRDECQNLFHVRLSLEGGS